RRGHELGSKLPGWEYPSDQWVRECERLVELDHRRADVLAGRAQARGARELLEFGRISRTRRRYADAVRFYREGFDAQFLPSMGEAAYRDPFDAACAAVLAAAGEGTDPPPAADRARYREQAREWLDSVLTGAR